MNTLETPLLTSPMPADGPDWGTRPWARPIVHLAYGNTDNLVATAEVTYHGVRLRGMRLYRRPSDQSLMVLFPQKRYGETLDNVYYFMNPEEREQFVRDIVWTYENGVGRRRPSSAQPIPPG